MWQNLHNVTVVMAQRSGHHTLGNIEVSRTVKYDPKKNLITIEGDVFRGFLHLFDYGTTTSLLNALHSAKSRKAAKQIREPFHFKEMVYENYLISATVEFKDCKSRVEISISAQRLSIPFETFSFTGNSTCKKLPDELQQLQQIICEVQNQYLNFQD